MLYPEDYQSTLPLDFKSSKVTEFITHVSNFVNKDLDLFYLIASNSALPYCEFVKSISQLFTCELPFGEYIRYSINQTGHAIMQKAYTERHIAYYGYLDNTISADGSGLDVNVVFHASMHPTAIQASTKAFVVPLFTITSTENGVVDNKLIAISYLDLIQYTTKTELLANINLVDFVSKLMCKFIIDKFTHDRHNPENLCGFIDTIKFIKNNVRI